MLTDSVLAAIIAGTATLSASFLQLKSAALRDSGRGASGAARRRGRVQRFILLAIIAAAAVSGFALSQWLNEGERAAQVTLQRELQARVAEISRTTSELERTREDAHADIENDLLRRIGSDGIAVTATVAACRPASPGPTAAAAAAAAAAAPDVTASGPSAATPGATAASAVPPAVAATASAPATVAGASRRSCTEAEASPVTLCATIPAAAKVTEVALFSRPAEASTPWSENRFLPGQESQEARFASSYSESAAEDGTRQVCQTFAHWSADHARVVRVLVRYSL